MEVFHFFLSDRVITTGQCLWFFIRKVSMDVPRNALDRYLRVLSKKIKRITRSAGVYLFGYKHGLLFSCLLLHLQPIVDN